MEFWKTFMLLALCHQFWNMIHFNSLLFSAIQWRSELWTSLVFRLCFLVWSLNDLLFGPPSNHRTKKAWHSNGGLNTGPYSCSIALKAILSFVHLNTRTFEYWTNLSPIFKCFHFWCLVSRFSLYYSFVFRNLCK